MKKYILFDHDGVLVDTEFWYYKAGERALADIGFTLDRDQYLRDMTQGMATWAQAKAAGIDEQTIGRQRDVRDDYYQEYLRTFLSGNPRFERGSQQERLQGVLRNGGDRESDGVEHGFRTIEDTIEGSLGEITSPYGCAKHTCPASRPYDNCQIKKIDALGARQALSKRASLIRLCANTAACTYA